MAQLLKRNYLKINKLVLRILYNLKTLTRSVFMLRKTNLFNTIK